MTSTSTGEPVTFGDLMEKYLSNKEKIKTLETQCNIIRSKIEDEMNTRKTDVLESSKGIKAIRSKFSKEGVSKTTLPEEIWNRYKSVSKITKITIKRVIKK